MVMTRWSRRPAPTSRMWPERRSPCRSATNRWTAPNRCESTDANCEWAWRWPSRLRQRGLQLGLQAALRIGADHGLGRLAVAEQDQRRDRHHVEGDRRVLILVDVQLDHLQLVPALLRDLLHHR